MSPHAPTRIPLAGWTRARERSAIQDMLTLTSVPGLISLALGLPAPELFPSAAYGEAIARVLAEDPRALQYEPPLRRLKTEVKVLMARRGVTCREEQIFLTSGAQQGISLLARLLLDPGATVLLEDRAYSGFQQALLPYQPRVISVPSDLETGIDVDAVEALLKKGERPALLYTMSDGHNPLGVSMSAEKRRRLVELARAHGVPIIEDDAYGFLFYDELVIPPLRALCDRWVFYAGSFSKILAPALRVGWLVVPEELTEPLSILKESSDIDTATLAQRGVAAFLEANALPLHLAAIRREYRARRDTMLRALGEHFPREARWTAPSSGFFVWVELPREVDTNLLLTHAVEREGVAFLPGQAFWVEGGPRPTHGMRLNFSNCAPARIEEGIKRLSRAIATLPA